MPEREGLVGLGASGAWVRGALGTALAVREKTGKRPARQDCSSGQGASVQASPPPCSVPVLWAEVCFSLVVPQCLRVQGAGGKRKVLAWDAVSLRDLYEVGTRRRF